LKKILRKKIKIKQGKKDENEIAQTAASSLLALVNVIDESNKFKRLDEMQNHMSKKITEQRGDLQAANKEESVKITWDKKRVQPIRTIQLHLQAHQKTKQ
jgi:hypothetical protein